MLNLITDNLDVWASAARPTKTGGRGRAASNGKSPHGIQKLRELILELAVRGKLVPQDSNDEPASVLLKRIQSEKAKLIAEGQIKKDKPLPQITEDEKPYALPDGWAWSRITDMCRDWGQKVPDRRFTYLDVSAIDNSKGSIAQPTEVDAADAPSRARKLVREGTVIYSTVRPYLLNVAVIDKTYDPEPIASTAFAIVHPLAGISSYYVFWYLRSQPFIKYVESKMLGVAYPAINDNQFFSGLLPLPPLAEQHRIVAKVDELMVLCDRLEQEQADSSNAHQTLVETLLATLTQNTARPELVEGRTSTGSGRADFAAAWQRIAAHFDTLFTTEQSIDQLKQTILQLAVMGKLVSQNPNDEPASELLKRIQAEKAKLIAEGKIKKSKPVPPITEEEKPFKLPQSWEWVKPEEFSIKITDGEHFRPPTEERGVYFLSAKDVREEGIFLDDPLFISEETAMKALQRCNPEYDDLLIVSRGATVGRMCKVNIHEKFCLLGSVILVKPTTLVLSDYLSISLKSPSTFSSLINASGSTAQPAIYLKDLKEITLSLPPIEEQHRIVAKVDELMAICDALKARLNEAQITQVQLADAIVEQAVA